MRLPCVRRCGDGPSGIHATREQDPHPLGRDRRPARAEPTHPRPSPVRLPMQAHHAKRASGCKTSRASAVFLCGVAPAVSDGISNYSLDILPPVRHRIVSCVCHRHTALQGEFLRQIDAKYPSYLAAISRLFPPTIFHLFSEIWLILFHLFCSYLWGSGPDLFRLAVLRHMTTPIRACIMLVSHS